MNLKDMNKTLSRYPFRCLCGKPLCNKKFQFYSHDGGIQLTDFDFKVWLFVICDCGYEMSFQKLDTQLKDFSDIQKGGLS
jgi:hypothetical protein